MNEDGSPFRKGGYIGGFSETLVLAQGLAPSGGLPDATYYQVEVPRPLLDERAMKPNQKRMMPFILFALLSLFPVGPSHAASEWQKIDDGLHLGAFDPPIKSKIYHAKMIVLRIDPKSYALKLLCASEHDQRTRTVSQWSEEFSLLAAINASMYQNRAPLKSTGYMKTVNHSNNSRINKDFGSLMLFDPVDDTYPEVQIIDRRLQKNWGVLMKKYHSVVQNYRLISRGKKRGWPQKEVLHSSAAIGMDKENHVLFIMSLSPLSTHDFIINLLSIPISVKSAMYVEGGLEATLFLNMGDRGVRIKGRGEMDLATESPSRIPNVMGVVKRR